MKQQSQMIPQRISGLYTEAIRKGKPDEGTPSDLLCLGSGPPLVLIGGLHGHFEFQRPIAELLQKDFRVVCPSLPGEDMPAQAPDSLEGVASELLKELTSFGLDTFSLCGISLGGAIAFEMALQQPARVIRLASTVSFGQFTFLHARLKHCLDSLLEKGWETACRRISRSTLLILAFRELAIEIPRPSQVWNYWNRFRRYRSKGDLVWKRLKMMRKISLLDRVSQLKMPVLVVAAEKDCLVHPCHAIEMAQRIPQAQLKIVAGSGHLFPFLRPRRLTQILAPFLESER